jgi:hypothetical protein
VGRGGSPERPGIVYVFEPWPGTLKVGYTRNLVQRLSTFQVDYSLETRVLRLALVVDPLKVEDLILTALIPWRIGRTSEFLSIPPDEYCGVLAIFDNYAEEYAYERD